MNVAGAAVGGLCFCLSTTPSLLPRDWLFQGLVCGSNAAFGYGLGVVLVKIADRVVLRNVGWWPPPTKVAAALKTAVAVVSSVACVAFLVASASWQRQVSALMGIAGPTTPNYLATLGIALLVGAALVSVGRLLVWASRRVAGGLVRRWHVHGEVALFIGSTVVVALVVSLVNGVLIRGFFAGAAAVFEPQNAETSAGVRQPALPEKSGSPASLVAWNTLGAKGRDFVAGGPRADELTRVNGRPAKEPIRVYAGLDSAETNADRMSLLVAELERTGALGRKVLAVVPTTGTGWIDPVAARALELVYNGDTAMVGVQYSYLPSWISFLGDQQTSRDSGRLLIGTVHDRWRRLPAEQRPKLVLYGESLGALAGQGAFGSLSDVAAMGFDAVLWVGPPHASSLWRELVARRDPGTTEVAPTYDHGRTVRFSEAMTSADIAGVAAAPWHDTRVLFLQHPSDPVVWWSPDLAFHRPDWLAEPPGPDRTPAMRWYPLVTFWQVTADLAAGERAPAGHGHRYGDMVLDGWVAVAPPDDWRAEDTERIREALR